MTAIATLRATDCTHLLYICSDVIAACNRRTAYLIQHREGTKVDEATCIPPHHADSFVPWLTPGAPVARVRAVWGMRKGETHAVFAERADEDGATEATSRDAAPAEIISGVSEDICSMYIFHQSILALHTPSRVLFYSLDPSPSATTIATRMGSCALPVWSRDVDAAVDVVSSVSCCATTEKTIYVACFTLGRMFVATVVCASSTSAVVVRRTAMPGTLLSSSFLSDPAETRVCKWTVRWSRQEMLMLCGSAAGGPQRLAGFSLQSTKGREMSKWMSSEELAAAVSGASPAAVGPACDLCSDADGTHVWLCDTATGPSLILREVTAASPNELVLAGSQAGSRVMMVAGASSVFVLSGSTLYLVKSSHTGSASESASALLAGTASAGTAGSAPTTAVGSSSGEQETKRRKESSITGILKTNGAVLERSARSPHTSSTPLQPVALTTPGGLSKFPGAEIKAAVLQYVMGTAASVSYVVRDSVYVHKDGNSTSEVSFTHEILSAINERFDADRHQHALACVRYASVAQSLHPYTVLELLRNRRGSSLEEAPAGRLLALASSLADKPTLKHGGLRRLPAFDVASAAFFDSTSGRGPFTSELEKKRYVADICGAVKAALAGGALGAAHLLFCVAARAVSLLYCGIRKGLVQASQPYNKEEELCEASIADCVSLVSSYVNWSLSASTSLGVMSAHVGALHTLTKEAALHDGEAHLIDTSRHVQIRPMKVLQQPKRPI
ncbi:hypothetical protein JKF63_04481 [Porcisia hertigi]|uniref:Uncharacterized protein n=1 Tax=Porcisia hertigi TaxID=2761500 RepID=A0A836I4S5_9TRYP|nr:hypothetical protein JKF63_04481 [Porcisia hertigi]